MLATGVVVILLAMLNLEMLEAGDSGINDGRAFSCSVLLNVWSCRALSTDGTRRIVNAQA